MLLRPVVFFLVQASACLYAARRGGWPERLTAVAMAIAAITTALLPDNPLTSFRTLEWGELSIDVALLIAFVALFCCADRFWTIWVASLQFIAIAVHAVRAYDPLILPSVYSAGVGWIAYPMIALLIAGTYRHQQRTRIQPEADWSPIRW